MRKGEGSAEERQRKRRRIKERIREIIHNIKYSSSFISNKITRVLFIELEIKGSFKTVEDIKTSINF